MFAGKETGSGASAGWDYRIAGLIGGGLLAAGHFYTPLALLQLVAFIPLLVLLLRHKGSKGNAAVAGLYMAMAFTLPQMAYLRMPVVVTIILLVYMMTMIVICCFALGAFIKKPMVTAAILSGIVLYTIDYLGCTLLPIWGLAQSLVRPWSGYPLAIGFISYTGICGVMLVIIPLQVLFAHLITGSGQKARIVFAIASMLAICVIGNYYSQSETKQTLRIATVGWVLDETQDQFNPDSEIGFNKLFLEPARHAVSQGAKLITSGELGFYYNKFIEAEKVGQFTSFAAENKVWLIIGVFDTTRNENKILFISPDGLVADSYVKSHLTPLEQGVKGTGQLKTVKIDGYDIGAMICQDDNFLEQTAIYGQNGTGIVICPTADWTTVRRAHLQAVCARAIECRYSIVRPAANGISAIITPNGEIMQATDHYLQGPGYLLADVPVGAAKTVFSKHGFALPLAVCLLVALLLLSKKNRTDWHG